MSKSIVISNKDSLGKNEVYWEFFKCTNCASEDLLRSFVYCPNCGCKLEWDLTKAFSMKETVIIKTGKLAGVSGSVYDYDRKTGKVEIKLDSNNIVTVDYANIIRMND